MEGAQGYNDGERGKLALTGADQSSNISSTNLAIIARMPKRFNDLMQPTYNHAVAQSNSKDSEYDSGAIVNVSKTRSSEDLLEFSDDEEDSWKSNSHKSIGMGNQLAIGTPQPMLEFSDDEEDSWKSNSHKSIGMGNQLAIGTPQPMLEFSANDEEDSWKSNSLEHNLYAWGKSIGMGNQLAIGTPQPTQRVQFSNSVTPDTPQVFMEIDDHNSQPSFPRDQEDISIYPPASNTSQHQVHFPGTDNLTHSNQSPSDLEYFNGSSRHRLPNQNFLESGTSVHASQNLHAFPIFTGPRAPSSISIESEMKEVLEMISTQIAETRRVFYQETSVSSVVEFLRDKISKSFEDEEKRVYVKDGIDLFNNCVDRYILYLLAVSLDTGLLRKGVRDGLLILFDHFIVPGEGGSGGKISLEFPVTENRREFLNFSIAILGAFPHIRTVFVAVFNMFCIKHSLKVLAINNVLSDIENLARQSLQDLYDAQSPHLLLIRKIDESLSMFEPRTFTTTEPAEVAVAIVNIFHQRVDEETKNLKDTDQGITFIRIFSDEEAKDKTGHLFKLIKKKTIRKRETINKDL
uniref:Uncharacterized protein n=1 Tax=Dikerogammarus haemobaphes virus 1 TaxID=2704946 RepID=A0A6G9HEA9_9VIRU|nr:hypothetical protein [Dikerogammarus haemobaphes virus 1]